MTNDLLEVQLLWSQTIAQVVTAVEMTELMALWEWEGNGLNHGSGSLIKYQDPAMNNILSSKMFSLINIVLSRKLRYIVRSFLLFLCIPHNLVITTSPCPFLWQFECQSLECPAVCLLCVIQPLMLSFEHCIEKKCLFRLKHFTPFTSFSIALSVNCLSLYQQHFLIPPMLSCVSDPLLFSLLPCPTAFYHPPSPPSLSLYFPHYAPLHLPAISPTASLSLSLPLPPFLAFLCSGPICSHYTDGPDDSVEWCTLSRVPLQGLSLQPAHAAALSRGSSLGSFSLSTMTARHPLLSLVTSWYYHIGYRDLCSDVFFI